MITGDIEQGDAKAAGMGIAASLLAAPQEVSSMLTAPTEVRVESGTVLSSVLLTSCFVDACGHPNPDIAAAGLRACLEIAEQATIDDDEDDADAEGEAGLSPATVLLAALAHRGLLSTALDVVEQHANSASGPSIPEEDGLACAVAAVQLVRKLLSAIPTALGDVSRSCRQLAAILSVAAGAIVACSAVTTSEATDETVAAAADDFFECFEEAADALVDVCSDYGLVGLAAAADPSPTVSGMVRAVVHAGVAVAGAAQAIVSSATAPSSLAEAAESLVTMAHDVMDVAAAAASPTPNAPLQAKALEAVAVTALAAATSQPGLSAAQRVFGWECLALAARRGAGGAEVVRALAEARLFALVGPAIDSAVAGAEVVGKRHRNSGDDPEDAASEGPAASTARLCTALAQLIVGLWKATADDATLRGRLKSKLVAPGGASSGVSRLDALRGAIAAVGNDGAVAKALQQVRAELP